MKEEKEYPYFLFFRIGSGVLVFITIYETILFYKDKEYLYFILGLTMVFISIFVFIASLFSKFKISNRHLIWNTILKKNKVIKWENVIEIDFTRSLHSWPMFLIKYKQVQEKQLMILGLEDTNEFLLDIYEHAPNIELHPKVKKRIEKAKNR